MDKFENKKSESHSDVSGSFVELQSTVSTNESWMDGIIKAEAGDIPVVKTKLVFKDTLGNWKVRWSFGRDNYRVAPGLYAVGKPDDKSNVFVSANYKLSFDRLRSSLDGMNGWILVIDTKGINVWCAAGKGTFGTDEIVFRTGITGLDKIVSHRKLILPQLGAPGVSAHIVKEKSGFRVIYGPVRANDIPAFINAKMKATPEQRRVRFDLKDRSLIIPNDLMGSIKYAFGLAIVFLLLSGIGANFYSLDRVLSIGILNALLIMMIYLTASVIPVILLPLLPGKSFSAKGGWAGLILTILILAVFKDFPQLNLGTLALTAWGLIIISITSFITMNYTGSSTYTSLSGVRKEMRVAVPIQLASAIIGFGLWITTHFI